MRFVLPLCALALIAASLPYSWTHRLTQNCRWVDRDWIGSLGRQEPSLADLDERRACLARRGLKSPLPEIKTVLSRWPS